MPALTMIFACVCLLLLPCPRLKVTMDRYLRTLLKKQNSSIAAWIGFLVLSILVWKLVSDGDFSFIMVSCMPL